MENKTVELRVEGMNCANCAASLNRFLEKKGLREIDVNFATCEVRFEANDQSLPLTEVKRGISQLGFQVVADNLTPKDTSEQASDHVHHHDHGHHHHGHAGGWSEEQRLWFCILFTAPLLIHHLLMTVGSGLPYFELFWVQMVVCLPVFVVGGYYFGKSALNSLKVGMPNMDVLIFIGGTSAFIYSIAGVWLNEYNYIFFETSAMIFTLVLLGNWIEHRAVQQTTTAIDELSSLGAERANRIGVDGQLQSVPIEALRVGDIVQVNEGDQIPADGRLLHGQVTIDESMLTGESLPVEKSTGDDLVGASVVRSGSLQLEVTATGKDTVLGRMIELVKTAQREKPSIQRLADRISAIFVPAVLSIAALTFIIAYFGFSLSFQQALMNSIAVLVISCPCAMGLATPTAVMVGVGRVVKQGILIKGGQTLETFAGIQNIVFDKTGTLTTGKFKIKSIDSRGNDPQHIRNLVYALEKHSSHPIAQSLLAELEKSQRGDLKTVFSSVKELKGRGVTAIDSHNHRYTLGSYATASDLTADNTHQVYLRRDDELLATIDLSDELRPDTLATIDYMRAEGVKPILLSGDRKEKVEEVARQLGIEDYHAAQLPEQKLKLIEQLSTEAPTAMVGDGINDAPALARATIGVSLGDASNSAIRSAQIVLLNGQLRQLPKALAISKHTLLTIKQNLFWAFAYNIIAIPVAALGFLNPMWGALFMAISDTVVIGNSLRLKRKKIR
ncbi:MAG: cation-translocating P-type ATPase [Bacteroidota bacterium]